MKFEPLRSQPRSQSVICTHSPHSHQFVLQHEIFIGSLRLGRCSFHDNCHGAFAVLLSKWADGPRTTPPARWSSSILSLMSGGQQLAWSSSGVTWPSAPWTTRCTQWVGKTTSDATIMWRGELLCGGGLPC